MKRERSLVVYVKDRPDTEGRLSPGHGGQGGIEPDLALLPVSLVTQRGAGSGVLQLGQVLESDRQRLLDLTTTILLDTSQQKGEGKKLAKTCHLD